MNALVIDASVVLRWAFDDEQDREGALQVAAALEDGRVHAIAPPTFLAEVAGVLVRAVRAGRIEPSVGDTVMDALARVGVDTDDPDDYARSAMSIALAHALHVQDAMYVETARRHDSPLVSGDLAQLRAAEALRLAAVPISEVPAWMPDSP